MLDAKPMDVFARMRLVELKLVHREFETAEALIERVRIPLDGGGEYFVSFIQVQAEDGTRPVLITTRQLIQD